MKKIKVFVNENVRDQLEIVRAIWKADYTRGQVGEIIQGIEAGRL
jgi:hypothetical protein